MSEGYAAAKHDIHSAVGTEVDEGRVQGKFATLKSSIDSGDRFTHGEQLYVHAGGQQSMLQPRSSTPG